MVGMKTAAQSDSGKSTALNTLKCVRKITLHLVYFTYNPTKVLDVLTKSLKTQMICSHEMTICVVFILHF